MFQLSRLSCFFGYHSWKYSKLVSSIDYLPSAFSKYENPERKCLKCYKQQTWLPGHGELEPGSWINKKDD